VKPRTRYQSSIHVPYGSAQAFIDLTFEKLKSLGVWSFKARVHYLNNLGRRPLGETILYIPTLKGLGHMVLEVSFVLPEETLGDHLTILKY